MPDAIEAVYRAESRRVFATLVRLLGDFDLAEEALSDAFRAALEQWPRDGVPANPRAWLVSAGRFKAIDGIRRRAKFDPLDDVADEVEAIADETPAPWDAESIEDDRLRLIFTCCHPALAPDAQVALTLREVCGLATEAIAQAFLSPAPTLAQRIVRAKAKIRDARIPYQVPSPDELPERLASALRVVYLVFNEGYSASSGQSLTRVDLSAEAIRLGRLLVELAAGARGDRLARADAAAGVAPRGARLVRTASSSCSPIRIVRCGTATRSRKAWRWWNGRSPRAGSVPTRCRPRSPPSTPRPQAPTPPTGPRSWASTTSCCVSILRPSSS